MSIKKIFEVKEINLARSHGAMSHFPNDLTVSIGFLFHKIRGWARSCVSTIHFSSKCHDSKNALESTKSYKKYSNIFRCLKYIL